MPRPTLPPGHVFHSFHNFLLDLARKTCNMNIDIIYQEKYSFRSILPSYAAYNASWWTVFWRGLRPLREWLFTPLRPGKSRIPPVFVYSRVPSALFPRVPQLPSRSRFTSFSCITAPVAVHTAVSLYSWSHANINAGFLTAQKRQVLSSRLHWHLNFLLLIADGLMADNNIDDRVFLLPCLWCLRSSPSSPSKTIRIHLLPLLFWWMRCTPYRFDWKIACPPAFVYILLHALAFSS